MSSSVVTFTTDVPSSTVVTVTYLTSQESVYDSTALVTSTFTSFYPTTSTSTSTYDCSGTSSDTTTITTSSVVTTRVRIDLFSTPLETCCSQLLL